jgi:hypothetical protein
MTANPKIIVLHSKPFDPTVLMNLRSLVEIPSMFRQHPETKVAHDNLFHI